MNSRMLRVVAPLALAALLAQWVGCRFPEELDVEIDKDEEVIVEDAPPAVGDVIVVLEPGAVIVEPDVIPVEVIPDITVLTFENFTDVDLSISYFVEGFAETVLVLFGETVSIEYDPCLADVQLDFEDDFDPATGLYLGSFDLSDIFLEEGFDYFCGDEIFFTFDPDAVFVTAQPL
jgi:hypothetical protein